MNHILKADSIYYVDSVVCDYGVYWNEELKLILNSRRNAEKIVEILKFDEKHEKGEIKMNFGEAIQMLKIGKRVARKGWNGKGIFIELQVPDAHSKMSSPYIFIDTTGLDTENTYAPRSRVPWLASQTDMLSKDWEVKNI